jgi:hypothetical protein
MEEILTYVEDVQVVEYIMSQLISLAISVFTIVCSWKIYAKAGENGWASLIPFYNEYINFKVAKKKELFIPYLIITILFSIAMSILVATGITLLFSVIITFGAVIEFGDIESLVWLVGISGIIATILGIILFVINIKQSIALSKAFNQGTPFAVGLIFMPCIFRAILAFSNDIQYNFDNSYPNNYNNPPPPYTNQSYGYQINDPTQIR